VDTGFVGPKAHAIFGGPLYKKQKTKQNYECKTRYKSEYLCRAPPRALEAAHASEVALKFAPH